MGHLPKLSVSPKELVFEGDHNSPIAGQLTLTNPHDLGVCFTVLTTAPYAYNVRPNFAWVDAGSSFTVEVVLQPKDELPPPGDRKHKFLVQMAWKDFEDPEMYTKDWWIALRNKGGAKNRDWSEIRVKSTFLALTAAAEEEAAAAKVQSEEEAAAVKLAEEAAAQVQSEEEAAAVRLAEEAAAAQVQAQEEAA
eukprot:COSAG02_NODE_14097_length_1310_cov_1902.042940_1_plen_192_part_10